MIYDVIIIGDGAAEYGCAMTVSSVEKTKEFGIAGNELFKKRKNQLKNYESCELL